MLRTGLFIAGAYLTTAIFAPPPFHTRLFKRSPVQGSDLGRRVTSAPDGLVKMTYAARDGICGDGRSFIADASSTARGYDVWFADGMSMSGSMSDLGARCARGPVRLREHACNLMRSMQRAQRRHREARRAGEGHAQFHGRKTVRVAPAPADRPGGRANRVRAAPSRACGGCAGA